MDQRKYAFRSGIQIKLDANERRKLVYEIELNPLLRSTLDNAYFGCSFSVPRVLWHPAGIDLKLDCFQAGLFQLFDAMLDWVTHVASISRGYIYLYVRLGKIYIYIYIWNAIIWSNDISYYKLELWGALPFHSIFFLQDVGITVLQLCKDTWRFWFGIQRFWLG